ncbi:hypothetical protein JO84_gp057 [Aureococcus anophagefferens virus]|uniref:Uncharacterized protein n=1 Tax=Aureococcus anophagefferens virus TaxID=1474867 RepID=A0A076FHS7_9VIRU|nr:hypothetical protein JO84_gp057 [Aureococcus anophagefferens virus]AII16981.1 hypothetical protein AaV_057 [Aureococcus anophagefferens virus]UOG94358.1 hypothetical protein MKD35_323 [Aureococcus anophagefferens virus]
MATQSRITKDLDCDSIYNYLSRKFHKPITPGNKLTASECNFLTFYPFHHKWEPKITKGKKKDLMCFSFCDLKGAMKSSATCIFNADTSKWVGLYMDTEGDKLYYFNIDGDSYDKITEIKDYFTKLKKDYKDTTSKDLEIIYSTDTIKTKIGVRMDTKIYSGLYCIKIIQDLIEAKNTCFDQKWPLKEYFKTKYSSKQNIIKKDDLVTLSQEIESQQS